MLRHFKLYKIYSQKQTLSHGPQLKSLLGSLAGALKRRHWGRRVGVRVVLLQGHADVIFQIELSLGIIGLGLKVHDKIILDSKDRVNGKMRVVAGIDLVDDSGVVRVGNHQVDVGRTHGGAVHEIQQNTSGAVRGQRVWGWVVAVPVELSLGIRHKLSAKIVLGLLRVLEVIFPVGGGLPDIEHGAFNRLAGFHVRDDSMHVGYFAIRVGVLDDGVTQLAEGSVGRPKRPENDIGGRRHSFFGDDFIGNLVDQPVID